MWFLGSPLGVRIGPGSLSNRLHCLNNSPSWTWKEPPANHRADAKLLTRWWLLWLLKVSRSQSSKSWIFLLKRKIGPSGETSHAVSPPGCFRDFWEVWFKIMITEFSPTLILVCACVCLHMCVCARAHTQVRKLQVIIWCLSQSLSTLVLRKGRTLSLELTLLASLIG